MFTISFGYDSPPPPTPAGPVDALRLAVGSSYANFFGSSHLDVNPFDGDTLFATRTFMNGDPHSLGACCLFVQPGSAGTGFLNAIETSLDSLANGTIDGRYKSSRCSDGCRRTRISHSRGGCAAASRRLPASAAACIFTHGPSSFGLTELIAGLSILQKFGRS